MAQIRWAVVELAIWGKEKAEKRKTKWESGEFK